MTAITVVETAIRGEASFRAQREILVLVGEGQDLRSSKWHNVRGCFDRLERWDGILVAGHPKVPYPEFMLNKGLPGGFSRQP